jgi:hypothetical protein
MKTINGKLVDRNENDSQLIEAKLEQIEQNSECLKIALLAQVEKTKTVQFSY